MKIITRKFFELLPLFSNATVEQYLFLLQHPVSIEKDMHGTGCLSCGLLQREEARGKFINESPKFSFKDLKRIYEWMYLNQISGGINYSFCPDTIDLIYHLSKTEEDKKLFSEWAKRKSYR